jgi:hypothetical protein
MRVPLWCSALAFLVGCAPRVDLPQPRSPFDYQAPAYSPGPAPPDPNGPCVHSTHRRKSRAWWWKHGQLVEGGLVAATADDPRANGIARSAHAYDRAGEGLLISAFALHLGTLGTFVGLEAGRGDWTGPTAFGAGIGVVLATVGTAVALMTRGGHRAVEATKVYNEWAAEHGCHDPPAASR